MKTLRVSFFNNHDAARFDDMYYRPRMINNIREKCAYRDIGVRTTVEKETTLLMERFPMPIYQVRELE